MPEGIPSLLRARARGSAPRAPCSAQIRKARLLPILRAARVRTLSDPSLRRPCVGPFHGSPAGFVPLDGRNGIDPPCLRKL